MNRQPSPSDTSEASSLGEPPLTDSNAIRNAHDAGGMTTEPRLSGKLPDRPLRVVLLSLHGLIRSEEPQLGYDADTGGQVLYVLELARALSQRPEIGSVELLTRQIIDPKVGDSYAQVEETLSENCRIVRLPFGPRRYLKKESLWPFLDIFVDQCLWHFRRTGMPDLIHGHYADAGYAGAQLARLLHVPFVFTGHSLGRVKEQRLKAADDTTSSAQLETKFRFGSRIEAEEYALETAALVIASTTQEVRQQYELYDHYQPERMEVIPPGVDLGRFSGAVSGDTSEKEKTQTPPDSTSVRRKALIARTESFLVDPTKPPILAVARLDERKNFETLIEAYGQSPTLRERANLVLIMGQRGDLRELPAPQRKVMQQVLNLIDVHDLYGSVAYPKSHEASDIPALYRWAASLRGIFVNPALTEPFGLTLLEAAASGLPIVATEDGGPQDIIANCCNGTLIDPLDREQIEHALIHTLTDADQWTRWSEAGLAGVQRHYCWQHHVDRYVQDLIEVVREAGAPALADTRQPRGLPEFDRLIIADLDNTLDGDDEALHDFANLLRNEASRVGFGIATGRRLESVLDWLAEKQLPRPDVLATSAGTELYYGRDLVPDLAWQRQLDYAWQPQEVLQVLAEVPGLTLQDEREQSRFKISYEVDTSTAPALSKIRQVLRSRGLRVKLVLSLGMFLDVLPIRAGSDMAIRHLIYRWAFPAEKILVVGDSGNDEGMLKGRTLGVVVGNYSPELARLKRFPRIYFASGKHARGIFEGIEYYNFLEHIRIPNDIVES